MAHITIPKWPRSFNPGLKEQGPNPLDSLPGDAWGFDLGRLGSSHTAQDALVRKVGKYLLGTRTNVKVEGRQPGTKLTRFVSAV